nr:hypothetical protein [Cressdnaviricota sp.]
MGPWNTMDKGKPIDTIEAISYLHDLNIDASNKMGIHAEKYRQISDQYMLNALLKIPFYQRGFKWYTAYNGIKLRKATKINIWT